MILSPYLSLLLIAFGLGLIYLFRATPGAKSKRATKAIFADMTIACDVARASARQVFGVELDLTDKSISVMDSMIANGWREKMSNDLIEHTTETIEVNEEGITEAKQDEDEGDIHIDDGYYVLAGYFGTVLAHNHNGTWKTDDEHPLPYVYFKKHDFAVSPFDILRQKLQAPKHFDLAQHYHNIVWELERPNVEPGHKPHIDDAEAVEGENV